jgi:LEA14-like dessication related protein
MKPIDKIVIALAVLASFSAGSIALTAKNYVQGMRAARSVQVALSSLELHHQDTAEVLIRFHVKNESPFDIKLEAFTLNLYLNEDFIGSNYDPFTERNLNGFEETTIDFLIRVQPSYVPHITQAQQEESFSWSLRGRVKLLLPFRDKEVSLPISERWRGY